MNNFNHIYSDIKQRQAIDRWFAYFAKDYFDVLISNARYLNQHRLNLEEETWRFFVKLGDRLLDCGCGKGYFTKRVFDLFGGDIKIIGMDISETIIKEARKEYPYIDFGTASLFNLPFKNDSFDSILLIAVLEYIEDIEKAMKEIQRVLKPRGYLYITIHKYFIDPFIFPTLTRLIYERLSNSSNDKIDNFDFPPLMKVRKRVDQFLKNNNFTLIKKTPLLYQFEWGFYRRISPKLIPYLIKFGNLINKIPFSYFKDLEILLYQKQ